MENQVFISYSSQDKELADRVCAALENSGFSCWIAPRNIEEGTDYPRAILQAITAVKTMVVLLTTHAVASPHVLSEIGHAFNARKRILPVRLVSSNLPQDFDYFLSTQQWLDASEGFTDETLNRLIEAVSGSLVGDQETDIAAQRRKKRIFVATAGVVFLAAVGILGYWRMVPRSAADPAGIPPVLSAANIAPPEPLARTSEMKTAEMKTAEIKTAMNPKDGQKYVWIRPGSFTMGCSAADSECKDDEKPAHQVEIPTGFWLGQTEVTNAVYRKAAPAKASKVTGDSKFPIQGLSWPEAKAYCGATGGRLPTEAEWEYAARGGTREAYYDVPSKIAWYSKNSGGLPHAVGMKEPNQFGLYDVLGNVSEWVLDRYYNKYDVEADAVGPHVDQPLAGNATAVSRGGFWDAELASIRVSHRAEQPNDEGVETAGLRCANDHLAP